MFAGFGRFHLSAAALQAVPVISCPGVICIRIPSGFQLFYPSLNPFVCLLLQYGSFAAKG
jgi:hypothetical protein